MEAWDDEGGLGPPGAVWLENQQACLIQNGSLHWAVGPNNLLIMAAHHPYITYPYFFSDQQGHFLPLIEIESQILGRRHRLRVYLPPGYEENTLAHYPLAYMQKFAQPAAK